MFRWPVEYLVNFQFMQPMWSRYKWRDTVKVYKMFRPAK
jgi:hypothetical protein